MVRKGGGSGKEGGELVMNVGGAFLQLTSWSIMLSICNGFMTSATNCGCMYESLIFVCSSWRTVPWNFGLIFWGL